MKQFLFILTVGFVLFSCAEKNTDTIDLSGKWQVSLADTTQWCEISLPGTLCDAGIGDTLVTGTDSLPMKRETFLHLQAKYSYTGEAFYKREIEIPQSWSDKNVCLVLERVLWLSQVWIDGQKVDFQNNSLSTPHIFDLTKYLTAGKHTLMLQINNRKQFDISVRDMAHAYTNETQTMWNGVLGKIFLQAENKVFIEKISIFTNEKNVRAKIELNENYKGEVLFYIKEKNGKKLSEKWVETNGKTVEIDYAVENPKLWDEFQPVVYQAFAKIKNANFAEEKNVDFGFRTLTTAGAKLQINARRLFLRGTLECCIFPLKGYPPMSVEKWEKVFNSAKNYGLNHIRFHSWCPPEAAFEAADALGLYLQVELPYWQLNFDADKNVTAFVSAEADRILSEYGNHPSFCFLSLGNEIEGNVQTLDSLLIALKAKDNRRLYTATSFTFQKPYTGEPYFHNDYWITQWTSKGWVRGQGIFDSESPRFDKDYSTAVDSLNIPLITHEIGQYSVYPNLKEIEKYNGNLVPLNFMAVKNDLERKGRLNLAEKYLLSSGKLAAILYKEEIERALKTDGISGFQLLDLHDFPGQGTALVGLLDAFWDSKGIISAEEFRAFCAPVVPLARFTKACYTNNETFEAETEFVNYSGKVFTAMPEWNIVDNQGYIISSGKLEKQEIAVGKNTKTGNISVDLSKITKATQLSVNLFIEDTKYRNSWHIWVYPKKAEENFGKAIYTQNWNEAQKALAEGKNVLYNPDFKNIKGIEGKFVQVFWSPIHFPDQPGTMGILCDPQHAALADFPTGFHSDWQWWDICKHAVTMDLDSLDMECFGEKSLVPVPVISMVDNFFKNRNLALAFETQAGNGKLLVCSVDLHSDLSNRHAARQLRYSFMKFLNSK